MLEVLLQADRQTERETNFKKNIKNMGAVDEPKVDSQKYDRHTRVDFTLIVVMKSSQQPMQVVWEWNMYYLQSILHAQCCLPAPRSEKVQIITYIVVT